nr:MAG: putative RNA-dependent RNA polymerase [Lestijarvi obscuruvirus]
MDTRFPTNHGTLLYDEKFDTWLNLEPLTEIHLQGYHTSDWMKVYESRKTGIGFATAKALAASSINVPDVRDYRVSPLVVAFIQWGIFNGGVKEMSNSSWNHGLAHGAVRSAIEAIRIQVKHLLSQTISSTTPNLIKLMDSYLSKLHSLPSELRRALSMYSDLLKVINRHKILLLRIGKRVNQVAVKDLSETIPLPSVQGSCVLFSDLALVTMMNESWILSRMLLLELFNKVAETTVSLLYAYLQTNTSMPNNHYSSFCEFHSFLSKKMMGHLTKRGKPNLPMENVPFIFLKNIEGLGVSQLIERSDRRKGWVNDLLGPVLWKGLCQERKNLASGEYRSSQLYKIFSSMEIVTIAEVIGTVKLHGHPSIEVAVGLQKLYDRTHAVKIINKETRSRCIGILKRDICKVYYQVHNRYPMVKLSSLQSSPDLQNLLAFNMNPNKGKGKSTFLRVSYESWYQLQFEKNAEFDPIDNILGTLKDTALGQTRADLAMQVTLAQQGKFKRRTPKETKVLLSYLMEPYFDQKLRDYMKNYVRDDWNELVLNYLVIKLTPKELELKVEGRMFGGSPLPERMRRIIQEYNGSKFMDRYIPDQLLTPGELEVLRRLLYFRTMRHLNPKHYVLNISFDFSAWNSTMRSETVDVAAGDVLDNWFGTQIYGKTMKAFQNMKVYYDDGRLEFGWEGQEGGIEGLNQVTWSLIFIPGIKYALEKLNYVYQVTVKGDDVRAAIMVPKSHCPNGVADLTKKQQDILKSISEICSDMGWKLNPQESFVSLSIIATSKQYLCDDTWLPTSAKKILKLMSHSNMILCTTEDLIASMFSIAHSTCSQTTTVMPAYTCATLMASLLLTREFQSSLTENQITVMLMWSQVMGGPGPLPLQTFFVRGENDMLSVNISLFSHILQTKELHRYHEYVVRIVSQELKVEDKNILVSDPYALPIKCPRRPMTIMKEFLKKGLIKITRNVDFKEVLKALKSENAIRFKDRLLSMEPYMAKLSTCIWENSPFYLIEELIAKFCQSSTILQIMARGRAVHYMSPRAQKLMSKVVQAARDRDTYWNDVLNGNKVHAMWPGTEHMYNSYICATDIASFVRSDSWGFDVMGITYPSLIDQTWLIDSDSYAKFSSKFTNPDGIAAQYSFMTDRVKFETDWKSHHYASVPGIEPWVGSRTSTDIKYEGDMEGYSSPTLVKIKNLLALHSFGRELGDDVIKLTKMVLNAYVKLPNWKLEVLAPRVPYGHIAHRVPINSYSLNTCPNSRPNISQLVHKTDRSCIYPQDGKNYSINFPARHFMCSALVTFPLQFQPLMPDWQPNLWHAVFDYNRSDTPLLNDTDQWEYSLCTYCCADVSDPKVSISDLYDVRELPVDSIKLVSASAVDRLSIENQIVSILKNKIKATIDPMSFPDYELQRASAINILEHQADWIRLMAHLYNPDDLNFQDIPMDLLLSNPSKFAGQSGSTKLSTSAWSQVDSRLLYEAVTIQVFKVVLIKVGPSLEKTTPTMPSAEVISDTKHYFGMILRSGVLLNLLAGCRKHDWLTGNVPVSAYMSLDAEVLTRTFLEAHWSTFHKWITEPGSTPFNIPIMGENKLTLGEAYMSEVDFSMQWLTKRYHHWATSHLYGEQYLMARYVLREIGVEKIDVDDKLEKLNEMVGQLSPKVFSILSGFYCLYSRWNHPDPDDIIHRDLNPGDIINLLQVNKQFIENCDEDGIPLSDMSLDMMTGKQLNQLASLLFGDDTDNIRCLSHFAILIDENYDNKNDELNELITFSSLKDPASFDKINQRVFFPLDPLTAKHFIKVGSQLDTERIEPAPTPIYIKDLGITSTEFCHAKWCSVSSINRLPRDLTVVMDDLIRQGVNVGSKWMRILSMLGSKSHAFIDLHKVIGKVNHSQLKWSSVFGPEGVVKIKLPYHHKVGVIGDGSGGMSTYLAHLSDTTVVSMMTLRPDGKSLLNLSYADYNSPSEVGNYSSDITTRIQEVVLNDGDLLSQQDKQNFQDLLFASNLPVVGIACDADISDNSIEKGDLEVHLKIIIEVITLGSQIKGGGFIVYRSRITSDPRWWQFHYNLFKYFPHHHFVRPLVTQIYSKEIYVILILPTTPLIITREDLILVEPSVGEGQWIGILVEYETSIKVWAKNVLRFPDQARYQIYNLPRYLRPMLATPEQLAEMSIFRSNRPKIHLCKFREDILNYIDPLQVALINELQDLVHMQSIHRLSNSTRLSPQLENLFACYLMSMLASKKWRIRDAQDWLKSFGNYLVGIPIWDEFEMAKNSNSWSLIRDELQWDFQVLPYIKVYKKIQQYWWRLLGYLGVIHSLDPVVIHRGGEIIEKGNIYTEVGCKSCRSKVKEIPEIGNFIPVHNVTNILEEINAP